MAILFILFIVVPIVELALLILLGQYLGIVPTIALIFVTGALGAALARWQGLQVLRKLRGELGSGRMPGGTMFEAVLILIAGALLITPGVLTDVFGFLLLVPLFRRLMVAAARRWAGRRFHIVTVAPDPQGPAPDPGPIKDAEVFSVRTEQDKPAS